MAAGPADAAGKDLQRAEILLGTGRSAEALEHSAAAAAREPGNARAHVVTARALLALDRPHDAVEATRRALAIDPLYVAALRILSIALGAEARTSPPRQRKQLVTEAVEAARRAVELVPMSAANHRSLGEAASLAHDRRLAHAAIAEAIRLAPHDEYTWIAASAVAIRLKDWAAAESAARQALAINPTNAAAANNLGVAVRNHRGWREGTQVLAEAVRLDPRNKTARRNLSASGLRILRIAMLILLLPLLLLPEGGVIYLTVALVSTLFFRQYPGALLAVERWTTPVALRFGRAGRASPDRDPPPGA